jgi:hypothetical protein
MVYFYIHRYPELQERRHEIVSTLCDFAEGTVKLGVQSRDMAVSLKYLEKKRPEWSNKQTVEHTGNIGVVAGLLSKDDILKLSDADLAKVMAVRQSELAALPSASGDNGADDVRRDRDRE